MCERLHNLVDNVSSKAGETLIHTFLFHSFHLKIRKVNFISEQKKAIDMTPEELKQWLSSLTVPEDDEIPCYYFTTSDPYLKHEPLDPNKVVRGISFDDDGNINTKTFLPSGFRS